MERRRRGLRVQLAPRGQGGVAEAAGIAPEAISSAKFFPKMAAACHCAVLFELRSLDT